MCHASVIMRYRREDTPNRHFAGYPRTEHENPFDLRAVHGLTSAAAPAH